MSCRCRKCGEEFRNFAVAVYHGKKKHGKTCTKSDIKRAIRAHVPEDVPGRMKKGFQSFGCLASVLGAGIVFVLYAVAKGITLPFHVIYELLD